MNTKINKLKKSLLGMQPKVVKVTKTDYTLDNGDVYEHTFSSSFQTYFINPAS